MEPDFTGWATKNDLQCADGLTIRSGAFKQNDRKKVPLVWQHQHNDAFNVLGHAMLENRAEGVYAYGYLNNSPAGENAREMLQHGDITQLSIYANNLKKRGNDVLHGNIREVSLVLSGANPGAFIDFVNLEHGEDSDNSEAFIYTGLELEHSDVEDEEELDAQEVLESLNDDQKAVVHGLLEQALQHSADEDEEVDPATVQEVLESLTDEQQEVIHGLLEDALAHSGGTVADKTSTDDKTIKDVFDSMSDEQKQVVYYMIGEALESTDDHDGDSPYDTPAGSAEHSGLNSEEVLAHIDSRIKEGFEEMSRNVFEQNGSTAPESSTLSHSQLKAIFEDAQKPGTTLRESFLAHAQDYGVTDIDLLFPQPQMVNTTPEYISRRMEWVQGVLDGVKRSPFSRIKSTAADITAEDARAKGYVKGNLKKSEIIKLLARVTLPTTVYKKQKLDRDDIVDIVDLDVVSWIKSEMRLLLDEEIARAILIGDGREPDDPDKINEESLRPIAYDDEVYVHNITVPSNTTPEGYIEAILRAFTYYKGTGVPTLYTTNPVIADLLLIKDKLGRRIYNNIDELASTLRVDKIVNVEAMESHAELVAVVVNMVDYTVGADKGGQIGMFDFFDIDFNQQKYLMETRISGALVKPKSALVLMQTSGTVVTPTVPGFDPATHTITIPAVTGVSYYDVTDLLTDGVLLAAGTHTITATTDVQARANAGYEFPHNTQFDWTFAYTA